MEPNLEQKCIFIVEYEHGDGRNLGGCLLMARVPTGAVKETRPN
jgi:hypothetical protein